MASNAGAPQTYPLTVTVIALINAFPSAHDIAGVGTNQAAGLGGYVFLVNAGGQLVTWNPQSGGAIGSAPGGVTTGQWYYLAWTAASATNHRFFALNYQSRTVVVNEAVATNLGALAVSPSAVKACYSLNSGGAAQEFFNGTIRQIAYYNKEWTGNADAFRAMAYLGPSVIASPTLLYNFQSGSGTTVKDQQGSANSGTLANFTGTFWVPMAYPRPFWIN